MEENKNLLLKGAMTYGFAMGIFWVVKYLFFIFSVSAPALGYIYIILTLAVPFVAYNMTKRYELEVGQPISFFHAWRFGTMLYFFAALIVSLEHFVFYKFLAPPDFLPNAMKQMVEILKELPPHFDTETIEQLSKTPLTPSLMVIQSVFNNVFYGIIFSLPVAAILRKRHSVGPVADDSAER